MGQDGEIIPASDDREGTASFVRTHIGWMFRVAQHYMRDTALAEDAVQNAFAQVFSKSEQFAGRSSLRTWIRRIVVNESLMILRKRKAFEQDHEIDALLPEFDHNQLRISPTSLDWQTGEQRLINDETRSRVQACIARLPDAYRVVLLLRDIEERSNAEVADQLGITETNTKVRLHRARSALKRIIELDAVASESQTK